MRGRKAKPPALKLVEGNRGKRRIEKIERVMEAASLPQPDFLSSEEKFAWEYVTGELKKWGLLASSDLAGILSYCHFYALYTTAKKRITAKKGGGEVTKTKTGRVVQNPWLKIANEALRELSRATANLGLGHVTGARMPGEKRAPLSRVERLGLG